MRNRSSSVTGKVAPEYDGQPPAQMALADMSEDDKLAAAKKKEEHKKKSRMPKKPSSCNMLTLTGRSRTGKAS